MGHRSTRANKEGSAPPWLPSPRYSFQDIAEALCVLGRPTTRCEISRIEQLALAKMQSFIYKELGPDALTNIRSLGFTHALRPPVSTSSLCSEYGLTTPRHRYHLTLGKRDP